MQHAQKINASDLAQYEEVLRAAPLFEKVKTDVLSEFLSMSTIVTYQKNASIFNIEDKADWFYLIIKGWVKIYRETMDGDEAIIDIFGKNDVFGEGAIFDDFIYNFNADAIEETSLIKLPIGVLAEKIEHNQSLAIGLLKHIATKNSAKNKEIEHSVVQNAPQRIGCFLLRLCAPTSKKQDLHLPFDKLLLASKLGMKPETFSRALAKLKDETEIIVNGRHIEIPSVQNLSKFCCSACSSQFPCEA